jgi:hypothetical protein
MTPKITMLELVHVVREFADTDAEIVATVVHMVNGGTVELAGNFRGRRFELDDFAVLA